MPTTIRLKDGKVIRVKDDITDVDGQIIKIVKEEQPIEEGWRFLHLKDTHGKELRVSVDFIAAFSETASKSAKVRV
jgi:hypothetical protein